MSGNPSTPSTSNLDGADDSDEELDITADVGTQQTGLQLHLSHLLILCNSHPVVPTGPTPLLQLDAGNPWREVAPGRRVWSSD